MWLWFGGLMAGWTCVYERKCLVASGEVIREERRKIGDGSGIIGEMIGEEDSFVSKILASTVSIYFVVSFNEFHFF